MAQAIHAAFLFAQKHPDITHDWMHNSQYLIVVGVPDETTLLDYAEHADTLGIPTAIWHEPDLPADCVELHHPCTGHHQATAVAFAPIPASRRLCANLPLAGKQAQP